MLIRLLCVHEMTKHVCKTSRLNSKRLLRKLQTMLGATFWPHPVDSRHVLPTKLSPFLSWR